MNVYKKRLKRLHEQMRLLDIDHLLLIDLTNIAYISGFVGTAGAVIVHQRRGATLVVDSRYHLQALEQAPPLRIVSAQGQPFDAALDILQARKGECIAFEADAVSFKQHRKMRRRLKGWKLFGTDLIEHSRMIKDDQEIAAIRRAVRLTDRVVEEIIADLHPDMRERDVAAEIIYRLIRRGAENVSFDPIVASGPRSALPHAQPGTRKLGRRSLILATGDIRYRPAGTAGRQGGDSSKCIGLFGPYRCP